MEPFAKSPFWRGLAVALVAAVAYLGWAIAGDRTILPVAHAGGVFGANGPQSVVYTTNEAGDVLYVWLGGAVEQHSWASATVTARRMVRVASAPPELPPAPQPR